MKDYLIKDLIDEETDDVEVPIDQYWATAGRPIQGNLMNIHIKCPHCGIWLPVDYVTWPQGTQCTIQCDRCHWSTLILVEPS